ncbi:hypothetical protein E4U40_003314, partial [Claviceps sp. LM458 group G5]
MARHEPPVFATWYLIASFIVLHDAKNLEDDEVEHDVTEREHDSEVFEHNDPESTALNPK